jgi:uncharacterized protein
MTFVDFIAIFAMVIISQLVTFYLGKRWQFWFNLHFTGYYRFIYWSGICFVGLSFILIKLLDDILVSCLHLSLITIAGLMICSVFITAAFDLIYWFSKKRFKPNLWHKISFIIAVVALFCFGHEMAINTKIVHYQIKINKLANVESLRIVQLSDIHINDHTSTKMVQQMIEKVNALKPDFIMITGDTLDRHLKPFVENGFNKQFQQLKSKYGNYIILGNHEYLGLNDTNNREEDIINTFKQANLNVLKDDVIYFDNVGITLIGRDDFSSSRYGVKRASLSDLILFSDTDRPIILLDHQPRDINEVTEQNVDLMLSGHTHGGQIFPINILVAMMYKNAYGIYQNAAHNFTSIVSSGYGFGGPPIRLMTQSEIVVIDVSFLKK